MVLPIWPIGLESGAPEPHCARGDASRRALAYDMAHPQRRFNSKWGQGGTGRRRRGEPECGARRQLQRIGCAVRRGDQSLSRLAGILELDGERYESKTRTFSMFSRFSSMNFKCFGCFW